MADRISTALALIDDRLDELHALMTDEPLDVVTERYHAWKSATRTALADLMVESALRRFDLARVEAEHVRPTPPVYLDAAASRASLMAIKEDLAADPALVLRVPPEEPVPAERLGLLKILDLLERRLPRAFRGRPETEREIQDGFETLLAGAGVAYQREGDSIVPSSRTCAPHFTFPGLQAALGLKLCNRPDRQKEIADEINDEIAACRTKYPHIIFGVYDLGFMTDADRFSKAFEAQDGIRVRVLKP